MICCISPDIKFDPWSDCTDLGNPTSVKNLIRDLTIVGACMFWSGTASAKRVDAHMIISKYWFLLLVCGKGPTQSISTRKNGSSNARMGISGALGIF